MLCGPNVGQETAECVNIRSHLLLKYVALEKKTKQQSCYTLLLHTILARLLFCFATDSHVLMCGQILMHKRILAHMSQVFLRRFPIWKRMLAADVMCCVEKGDAFKIDQFSVEKTFDANQSQLHSIPSTVPNSCYHPSASAHLSCSLFTFPED